MAYRNITRDDFNQVLQSLGNDPAILTDEIGPDHLRTANTAPWYTMQSKYQSLARSAHISAPSKPDPTEAELKKWRHLGVGQNKNGAYALLHDGQQALMLSKNQIAKGSWRLAEFNLAEAILVGPDEKRIVLRIQ